MKRLKKGFTLAEILITMGIIGVVAALAAPSLVSSSGNAKIGPQLQKAVSTFETAAELLLHDEDASGLSGLVPGEVLGGSRALGRNLSKYMKINANHEAYSMPTYYNYDGSVSYHGPHRSSGCPFISDDGMMYFISYSGSKTTPNHMFADIPNNQYIGEVFIDINGAAQPNKESKDVFKFALYNDGTLRPWGSKASYDRRSSDNPTWETHYCNSYHGVMSGTWTCAGSIFDNNMKVIYR